MVQIPAPLIEAVARRRCVLYLGAGVSKHAVSANGKRPPDWKEFLIEAHKRCGGSRSSKKYKNIRDLINAGDYLTACQIIKANLDDEWIGVLNDHFNNGYVGQALHKAIYGLDCPLVLTTNFDRIYDTKALELSASTISVKTYQDEDLSLIARGNLNQRSILKIHGSLSLPEKMVFTREDYARQRKECPHFVKMMEALLCTQTFLFLGCSFSDPDLILFLENYAQFNTSMAPHYALIPEGTHIDTISTWRKNYNLKVIQYSPANYHEELITIVEYMKDSVETERSKMADQMLW